MDTINILSIDPGTNMGITIFTVTVPNLEIVGIMTTVVDLSTMTHPDPMVDNLLLRTQVIQDYIRGIMRTYQPRVLAMEAAFVNSRFPKSVMYLSQYIGAISLTVTEMDPFIKIFNYPPKLVKKIMGGGKSNKDDMKDAVKKIPELTKFINPEYITEHEVDSMSIGYTYILEVRNNPVLLLMI